MPIHTNSPTFLADLNAALDVLEQAASTRDSANEFRGIIQLSFATLLKESRRQWGNDYQPHPAALATIAMARSHVVDSHRALELDLVAFEAPTEVELRAVLCDWGRHPDFGLEDWQQLVSNDDTRRSYFQHVVSEICQCIDSPSMTESGDSPTWS